MKCEICEKRAANGIIAMITNGHKVTRRICSACMAELRSSGFYSTYLSLLSVNSPWKDLVCPVCGRTGEVFQRTGRVGCAECYEVFAPLMTPVLDQLYGVPAQAEKEETAETEEKPVSLIDQLREEMFCAVNAEEYEKAAALRDRIRALQTQEDGE